MKNEWGKLTGDRYTGRQVERGGKCYLFHEFSETIQIRAQNGELIRGTMNFVLEMGD
jgi:hypothetical protein